MLSAAARFVHRQGAGQAEAYESVVAALLDHAEVAEEVGALTAQARASVAVLSALPAVGLAMIAAIDPDVVGVMFTTSTGLCALGVAVTLDALAVRIGSRLVDRVLR